MELSREEKVLIYVINILNGLVEKGIMEGGQYKVSKEGLDSIKEFTPTDEEVRATMDYLKNEGMVQ